MSIPALLIGSGLASMNRPFTVDEYVDAAMAISFVSGCFLFLLGFLNMGFLVRFISRPVLAGFMSACATLTMSSCVKDLLGAAVGKSTVLQQYVYNIAVALPTSNYPTIITGVLAISLMAFLQRFHFSKRLPPSLVAIAVFILASYIWFQAAGDSTTPHNGTVSNSAHIQVIGVVPSQFPHFRFPNFASLDMTQVLITSITIAFVGFMERCVWHIYQ
jgi:SulP family sulfate permease